MKSMLQRAIWITTFVQAAITILLIARVILHDSSDADFASIHTYIGRDYPTEFPVGDEGPVAMTLHESVHLSLNLSDDISNKEWDTMDKRRHWGNTQLGPRFRALSTVFGHQLHCLRYLHMGLLSRYGFINESNHYHWQHCLNYLRQTFLCDAVDTLEEGDFMSRDYGMDRMSGDLVCRDWMAVIAALDEKNQEWEEYNIKWVGPELIAPKGLHGK
ncbi:hypothetical protein DAEQUDRAFT_692311 [Daedalea quercina L-15889]|uniref:Oxidase ustYa n=1 Tax=Daedalea quercina L-15889 TaxID=1314783 RepID=A0A165PUL8_9APHY|nr:hypothetical protein DAEQUDRAFT_692311 [Daedalea quercina L-15889]